MISCRYSHTLSLSHNPSICFRSASIWNILPMITSLVIAFYLPSLVLLSEDSLCICIRHCIYQIMFSRSSLLAPLCSLPPFFLSFPLFLSLFASPLSHFPPLRTPRCSFSLCASDCLLMCSLLISLSHFSLSLSVVCVCVCVCVCVRV